MKRFVLISIVIAACGKSSSSGGGGGDDKPVDVGPVNAAIPAAWKGKIEFTDQTFGDKHEKYEAAAPKDWKSSFMPGSFEPDGAMKDAFGFGARYEVSGNCDGDCVAKDWQATADKVEFKQFTDGTSSAKIVKDEKGAGWRQVIAEGGDNTYIVRAWWVDGAKRYNACRATLGKEAKDLVPAFVAACQTAKAKE
ncbi:MAG TPA: hypothetical protein VL463_04535 [Kofleriaceae bacterium]|nr:hypothetical protein [Kofleriaceae bacterium]